MTLPIRTLSCQNCGKTFQTQGTRTYLCKSCQTKRNREIYNEHNKKRYAVIKEQNELKKRYIMVYDPLGEDGGIKPGASFGADEVFRQNSDQVPNECWEPGTIFRRAKEYFIVRYAKKANTFDKLEADEVRKLRNQGKIK